MSNSKIIGIDLGTTHACVAVMEDSTVSIIEDAERTRTIPSVVAFTRDNDVVVGAPAKRESVTNPENTFRAVKRFIGRKFTDAEVQKSRKLVPYNIVSHDNGDAWVQTTDGKKMSPQEVCAKVLMKMKKTAEDFLGEAVTEAVITVPTYFNDSQRQAIREAGRIAGLDVKRLINAPTATALAYGFGSAASGDRTVAVYDLGGGTFDISIIAIADIDGQKQFEVLSSGGNASLGGEDFDKRVIDYLAGEFKRKQGIDLYADPLLLQRLKEAAEYAKIELSSVLQTEVKLPYVAADDSGRPTHLSITLTRAKLESLVDSLVKATIDPCRRALSDAGVTTSDISEVILVGGQTRMPKVQETVKEIFGRDPRKDVSPDEPIETVAIGAAIQGAMLDGTVKDALLLEVTAISLGIETLGGEMTTVIPKGAMIPTESVHTFSTSEDGQTSIEIMLYRFDRKMLKDNKIIARSLVEGIPDAARGVPQIAVTFHIDADDVASVSAINKATGAEMTVKRVS